MRTPEGDGVSPVPGSAPERDGLFPAPPTRMLAYREAFETHPELRARELAVFHFFRQRSEQQWQAFEQQQWQAFEQRPHPAPASLDHRGLDESPPPYPPAALTPRAFPDVPHSDFRMTDLEAYRAALLRVIQAHPRLARAFPAIAAELHALAEVGHGLAPPPAPTVWSAPSVRAATVESYDVEGLSAKSSLTRYTLLLGWVAGKAPALARRFLEATEDIRRNARTRAAMHAGLGELTLSGLKDNRGRLRRRVHNPVLLAVLASDLDARLEAVDLTPPRRLHLHKAGEPPCEVAQNVARELLALMQDWIWLWPVWCVTQKTIPPRGFFGVPPGMSLNKEQVRPKILALVERALAAATRARGARGKPGQLTLARQATALLFTTRPKPLTAETVRKYGEDLDSQAQRDLLREVLHVWQEAGALQE